MPVQLMQTGKEAFEEIVYAVRKGLPAQDGVIRRPALLPVPTLDIHKLKLALAQPVFY